MRYFHPIEAVEEKLGGKTIHSGSFFLDELAEGTPGLCRTGHGAKDPDERRHNEDLSLRR